MKAHDIRRVSTLICIFSRSYQNITDNEDEDVDFIYLRGIVGWL